MGIFGDAWDWTKEAAGDVWGAVTDPVTGETVNPYDPNYANFQLSQAARQRQANAQYNADIDRQSALNVALGAGGGAAAEQQYYAGLQKNADRSLAARASEQESYAGDLRSQAAYSGLNQQAGREQALAAQAYGDAGVGTQQSAMGRLTSLASGNTAQGYAAYNAANQLQGQYGQAGVAGQEAGIARLQELSGQTAPGQSAAMSTLGQVAVGRTADANRAQQVGTSLAGYQGTAEQQAALERARAAQAGQTADTRGISRAIDLTRRSTETSSRGLGQAADRAMGFEQGAANQGLMGAAQQSASVGANRDMAEMARQSAAVGANQGMARVGQRAEGGPQDYGQQARGIQQLEQFAGQGPAASAAQAQLRQGQDAAIAGQMALARSGRGGAQASALRQAQANAAGIQQQTSAQSAQLRAQEEQAWRGQQLQALGTAAQARGQMQATMGGQELQGLAQASQAYQGSEAQRLQSLAQASQAYQGSEQQRLQGLAQAQQGYQGAAQSQLAALGQVASAYGTMGQQQLAGAQAVGGLEAQALSARDAAQTRSLQALGIEADQAQALGSQQLQAQQAALGGFQQSDAQRAQAAQALAGVGQAGLAQQAQTAQAATQAAAAYGGQQLTAQQAALQAYQAQMAQQAQSAQAAGQLGAAYGGQQLQALDQAASTRLQGQQIDDARWAQQMGLAQGYDQMTNQMQTERVNAALGYGALSGNLQNIGIQGQLGAVNAMTQAGLGYGGLMQGYDEMALQGSMGYENLRGGNIMSAQLGNQQSDAQRDAAIMSTAGSLFGAGIAASDVRAKRDIRKLPDKGGMDPASAALAESPGFAYAYRPEVMDATTAPPGQHYGPMAQDLERNPVTRSAVKQGPGGMKTIDTGRLALVDAAATGAQAKRIAELEKRLAEMGD